MDKDKPSILEQVLREGRLLSQRLSSTDPLDEKKYDKMPPTVDIPPHYRRKKKKKEFSELDIYDTKRVPPDVDLKNAPRDRLTEEGDYGTGVLKGKRMRDLLMMDDPYPKDKKGMI